MPEQRTDPALERRAVTLTGSTTIDGPEAPCSGHIRLKRYADHIFAQWGINRMNGSLHAQAVISIPLRELPDNDDIWGTSVQRVLDQIRAYRVRGATVFQITDWTWRAQSFDPGVVKQIIEWLTTAMAHKGMAFGGAALEPFLDWHMGFAQGVAMAGLQLEGGPEGVWWAIAQQRGWHVLATLPWREMRAYGMSDETIIDEILTIDILAWRQTYQIEDTDQVPH